MAVIAKMYAQAVNVYPGGAAKVSLMCVCEDTLMAHYHPENEDVVFTRYSPSGDCSLTVDAGVIPPMHNDKVYVLFHEVEPESAPDFSNCMFAVLAACEFITDYGPSKQVSFVKSANEWRDYGYGDEGHTDHAIPDAIGAKRATAGSDFQLKLTIDNPHASVQFKPKGRYWVSFWDAATYTADEAIALARA